MAMMIFKSKRCIWLVLTVVIFLNYTQCSLKSSRERIMVPKAHVDLNMDRQETSLTDAVNGRTEQEQEILKDLLIKDIFKEIIGTGFIGFQDPKESIKNVYGVLKGLGFEPRAYATDIDEIYIKNEKSINGLRNILARYESAGENPVFLSFELEPFKNGFDYVKNLMKESYSNLPEPCLDSVDNSVAYKDGDYVIAIYEITVDNIDLESMQPPRTLEDVGSISIAIEKSHEHYGDICGSDEGADEHLDD